MIDRYPIDYSPETWREIHKETVHVMKRYAKVLAAGSKDGKVYGRVTVGRIPSTDWTLYPTLYHTVAGDIIRETDGLLYQMIINHLGPNSGINDHTDPHRIDDNIPSRYHVPIVTTPEAVWWDAKYGHTHMEKGFVYGPLPYEDTMHAVHNPGWQNRVHLIVDVRP